MVNGELHETSVGSPQGGVISPLLANIYLDHFDQEMKKRNHRIVRYADDILILCCSEVAAKNAQKVAEDILEQDLKLTVNRDKTHLVHSDDGVKFLGVEIGSLYTRIQAKKLKGFKAKLKRMTKRNGGKPLCAVIQNLNPVLRGFSQYFKIANCRRQFQAIAQWVRRRLRSIQLKLWKTPAKLHRRLKQLGYKPPFRNVSMSKWNTSASPLSHYAMPNAWFDEINLFNLEAVSVGRVSQSK
jgi:hypothetical protein